MQRKVVNWILFLKWSHWIGFVFWIQEKFANDKHHGSNKTSTISKILWWPALNQFTVVVEFQLVTFQTTLVTVLGESLSVSYVSQIHKFFSERSNGDYMESINSFKRNGSILDGRSAHTEISSKSRQISPPDGASALNPSRSPPYSERYTKTSHLGIDHHNDW